MQVEISDILQAYAEGRFSKQRTEDAIYNALNRQQTQNFCRIIVLDVIHDPRMLTEEMISYFRHELGVSNMKYVNVLPRNTIIGRKLLSDSNESESPMFFLPFLPSHIAMPCKPGEHVWAFFESPDTKLVDIGYWCWRAVGFDHTDDVNHSHAPRDFDIDFYKSDSSKSLSENDTTPTYDFLNGVGNKDSDGKRYATANSRCISGGSDAYETILTTSQASKLTTYEAVPRFRKRPEDQVFEGSNNTLICLGTDRVDKASTSKQDDVLGTVQQKPTNEISGPNTGKIDIVVGRGQTDTTSGKKIQNTLDREELGKSQSELTEDEGDIDYKNDRTRILVAGKTLVDVNFGLDQYNIQTFTEDKIIDKGKDETVKTSDKCGDGAIALKSDKIRFIARSDLIMYVTSFERDKNGNMNESSNVSTWASFAIRQNGDIIINPGSKGVIKFGGDDADKGILVSDLPCTVDRNSGLVSGPGPVTTMGGNLVTGVKGQAKWCDRILVKS